MRTPLFGALLSCWVALLVPAARSQDCVGGTVQSPCVPDQYSADEVIAVSEIIAPYNDTVNSYSATELGANISLWYDAYVSGSLSQGSTVLSQQTYVGGGDLAEVYLNATEVNSMIYTVTSTHYLAPDPLNCDDPATLAGCYSPYNVWDVTSGGSGYSILGHTDDEGTTTDGYIEVAGTSWSVDTTLPNITSVQNANSGASAEATLNSTGYWSIYGDHLIADPSESLSDAYPTVAASGTGITLVVTYASAIQINVQYTIGDVNHTGIGKHDIGITSYAGQSPTSSKDQVNVGDPTPAISSISPSNWNAGTTVSFTISGSGFGTRPAVSVTGTVLDGSPQIVGTPTDTSISVSVTIDASAPSGSASITVTSGGYNGNGFQQAQTGQSATSSPATATVVPITPTVPFIVLGVNGGNICSGTHVTGTQTVYVGQQMAFTACIPTLPAGAQIASETWTPGLPIGTAVGGYTVTPSSGSLGPALSESTCGTSQSCSFGTFYWFDDGTQSYNRQFTRQFTFEYTLTNNLSSLATVTFNIQGPQGAVISQPTTSDVTIAPYGQVAYMQFATATTPGISFTASAILPNSSQLQLVQLVDSWQFQTRESNAPNGVWHCTPAVLPANGAQVLDTNFYYGSSTTTPGVTNAIDSPAVPLAPYNGGSAVGELSAAESFTMYLMWDPAALTAGATGSCTPMGTNGATTTCTSIPVPLGAINWRWSCDATNILQTLSNGTTWTRACTPTISVSNFAKGDVPPTWQQVIVSGQAMKKQCQ